MTNSRSVVVGGLIHGLGGFTKVIVHEYLYDLFIATDFVEIYLQVINLKILSNAKRNNKGTSYSLIYFIVFLSDFNQLATIKNSKKSKQSINNPHYNNISM